MKQTKHIWKTAGALLMLVMVMVACKKFEDSPQEGNFDNEYCNDPEAVNYNWNFPGNPNNAICYFPSDVFRGSYLLRDSIYFDDGSFDTVLERTLNIYALSRTKLAVLGLCGGDTLDMTADRFYQSVPDSLMLQDSSKIAGQIFCRPTDTISGIFIKNRNDTNRLRIDMIVRTDTGVTFHKGTAIKQ